MRRKDRGRWRVTLLAIAVLLLAGRPAAAGPDASTAAIRLLGYNLHRNQLVAFSDRPLAPRQTAEGDHTVVEFPGAPYAGPFAGLSAVPGTGIRAIRVEALEGNGTRVTFVWVPGGAQRLRFAQTQTSTGLYRLAVSLGEAPPEEPPVARLPARPASAVPPARSAPVGDLVLVRGLGLQGDRLAILTSRKPRASYFRLHGPERMVVDIDHARLDLPVAGRALQVNRGQVGFVHLEQHDDAVRAVVLAREATGPDSGTPVANAGGVFLPLSGPAPGRTAAGSGNARTASPHPGLPDSRPHLARVGSGWVLSLPAPGVVTFRAAQLRRTGRLMIDLYGGDPALPDSATLRRAGLQVDLASRHPGAGDTRLLLHPDRPVRYAAELSGGHLAVSFLPNTIPAANLVEEKITLDPGHGGDDPGAIGLRGTREKDVTLALATRLRNAMVQAGMEVQMTRAKDVGIELHPRVDIGDAFGSDVFISIHANAMSNRSVHGIETYYFNPSSVPLARMVHQQLISRLKQPDRGIRRNNFVVVKYNKMPACLVEIGYISNPKEEVLLASSAYQEKAAQAILAGVEDYFHSRGQQQ